MSFSSTRTLLLGAFAVTALASLVNAACSRATDVDSGTSESSVSRGPYGYSSGYGYYGGADLADDTSEF
jgi:hypothetical protein